MNLETLTEVPTTPPSGLGRYRAEDYFGLPDEPRCELIYGRLYVTPSPAVRHQFLLTILSRRLSAIAERSGGLALVAPMDVTLADHSVVQPDLLYVSAQRLGIVRNRIEGAPDLLVEVLSPKTARRDRGEKLKLYAESDVREYWLVDVAGRQIEFLVNRGRRFEVALPADGVYRSELVTELILDLDDLWLEVDRRLPESPGS